MKRSSIAVVSVLALGLTSAALAQPHRGDHDVDPQRVIDRLDSNGDGGLSIDEFREPPSAWARFDGADSNEDGMVTLEEIQSRIDEVSAEMGERAEARFVEMDLDGDGAVTEGERKQAMFNRVDTDADGLITADELAAAREAARERRGERGERRRERRGNN